LFAASQLSNPAGFYSLERNKVMNWKKIVLFGCAIACVFAVSPATAQIRGHGSSMPRMGMRGGVMPHSMGRMPMHRGPMMNSPSGLRRFGNRDFNRIDRFRRFNRFNDCRFVRNHRFNHFNHFNDVVFVGHFGFPWWWGWGWGPFRELTVLHSDHVRETRLFPRARTRGEWST